MIFNSLIKPKSTLTTLDESATLSEALDVLEETGYRCVPVLDKSGKIFRGNIYKMHLYRHKSRGGDMDLPVTTLLKNATKFISINAAFFTIFFAIRDLPYITVLDDNNQFYGILTHNSLLRMLAAGWNVKNGSYVLTVITPDERGALVSAAKEITRFCQITNVISLDPDEETMKRVLYTLPADVSKDRMEKIVKRLQKKGFEVPEIEDLHQSY
ncbi:cyclic di-AMP binding protein CbpA [Limosilactobacillus caccae]|uniref:cyclic di-AMP binding protein CbpA n=1 Tax=Limosilactobacillus caccae TaxID=1926284 RepID=UPI0009712FC4|nr:cyclic di-AMP binding protein CbpA [Limosilactobacillus caccae]